MGAGDAVRAEEVAKEFGTFTALKQVSLRLAPGRFLLVAGPNGAGKTTLLRLLAGLGRPTRGRVWICGADPHRSPQTRSALGLLSHHTLLYDELTARENLLFFAALYDVADRAARVAGALEQAGLSDWQDRRVRTFSRGMRQRLALARATLHEPAVVLLDEPFTGLDPVAAAALRVHLARLSAAGRTCVMVSHRLEIAAELADEVAILARGRLVYHGEWQRGSAQALDTLYVTQLGGSR
ncbi:MAG: heme ABC exporter ATP-binding protein CcmA [Candidatus Latescibacterota bacterium]